MRDVSSRARVIWDDALTRVRLRPGHPMAPVRLELTMRLARAWVFSSTLT